MHVDLMLAGNFEPLPLHIHTAFNFLQRKKTSFDGFETLMNKFFYGITLNPVKAEYTLYLRSFEAGANRSQSSEPEYPGDLRNMQSLRNSEPTPDLYFHNGPVNPGVLLIYNPISVFLHPNNSLHVFYSSYI